MDIHINDNLFDNFSGNAKDKVKEQVGQYAVELAKEAKLLEEAHREKGAKSEITSNIVMRAATVRRTVGPSRTPKWLVLCKIVSVVSSALSGFFFDTGGFQDKTALLIAFTISFATMCVSTVFIFIKE